MTRFLRALRQAVRLLLAVPLYVLLSILGVVSLGWNVVALVLRPSMSPERGRVFGRWMIYFAYRVFWGTATACGMMRIDARCLDALRDERGLILAANHPTMLDALLMVARLPRSACIMKAGLTKNVFIGAGARLASLKRMLQGRHRDWSRANLREMQRLRDRLTPENRRLLDDFAALTGPGAPAGPVWLRDLRPPASGYVGALAGPGPVAPTVVEADGAALLGRG